MGLSHIVDITRLQSKTGETKNTGVNGNAFVRYNSELWRR